MRFDGRFMGHAVPLRISRHTHPKARPDAAPPPVPTGIDYLSLLAARRAAETGGKRIDFANLAKQHDADHDEQTVIDDTGEVGS